ncbi:hypothetical protein ACYVU7_02200 [Arenicellales bacterium IMCC56312]
MKKLTIWALKHALPRHNALYCCEPRWEAARSKRYGESVGRHSRIPNRSNPKSHQVTPRYQLGLFALSCPQALKDVHVMALCSA